MTTGFTNKYKLRPKELYTALEELDFTWYPAEVKNVIWQWNNLKGLYDIAKTMARDADEVALLLMDLSRRGQIEPRDNGIWG